MTIQSHSSVIKVWQFLCVTSLPGHGKQGYKQASALIAEDFNRQSYWWAKTGVTPEKKSFCLALTCKEYPDFPFVSAIEALEIVKLYFNARWRKVLECRLPEFFCCDAGQTKAVSSQHEQTAKQCGFSFSICSSWLTV